MVEATDVQAAVVRFIKHPYTVAGSVVGLLGGLFQIPVLYPLLLTGWALLGKAFGLLGILVTVAPYIDGLPQSKVIAGLVVVGLLYLLKRGLSVARSAVDTYQSNN